MGHILQGVAGVPAAGDHALGVAVSLLVGGAAIYAGGRLFTGEDDFGNAVVTALAGAVAWALLAWVPLAGSFLALVAWIAVIDWRYPGGWLRASAIGVAAWVAAVVVLAALELVGVGGVSAFGVPGA
ncbi:MAG: hypothetical protein ABEH77_06820 [Halobacteriaceae archaeon]